MFKILKATLQTGRVTTAYPAGAASIPDSFRGAPRFDFQNWRDARAAAAACPTGAITAGAWEGGVGAARVDYGRCTFCGECAAADGSGAVTMTGEFELAVRGRAALLAGTGGGAADPPPVAEAEARRRIQRTLGRSLAIRQIDAGSCNGCELEIAALNNPIYDIERFGIRFVASPRHADMLLVTGPVTRNMESAVLKAYRATPEPKLVVAVGACGISGGIFGTNYATVGGVDALLPVDVYVPGCPPRPQALLHGILLALGRARQKGPPR